MIKLATMSSTGVPRKTILLTRVDVVTAFAASGLLDNHWD